APAAPPAQSAAATGPPEGQPETWRQYALAVPDPGEKPMIAIVIDDMGMDRKRSARAAGLPGPLTLSFLAYAEDLPGQGAKARAGGHELMLHVSMEPSSKTVDPGPNVLLIGDPPDEIRRRLVWGLERFDGFVGINNHMGSKFTEYRAGMDVVMAELKARGLLFLDSRTTPRSVGALAARAAGVPMVQRNVFLDNVNEVAAVKARLAETERVARRTGAAIAIGHPRDATLRALAEWVPTLAERGFVLVPLSAIVRAAIDGDRAG
ncbi:MAG: divergent polysaccharide deacetylase family protein, partial [Rhodospirillales bacterium]|nr:divergent polysaccharide deacetylase family protein [Rhodospirillales bacterium]